MLSQTVLPREARVRRALRREGNVLVKSRVRDPRDYRYGGYLIIDANSSYCVAGGTPEFCLNLEDVEAWAREQA